MSQQLVEGLVSTAAHLLSEQDKASQKGTASVTAHLSFSADPVSPF